MMTRQQRAEELTALRLSKGLTVYALSKATGITTTAITYTERGQTSPSLENYEKMLDALGLRLEIRKK